MREGRGSEEHIIGTEMESGTAKKRLKRGWGTCFRKGGHGGGPGRWPMGESAHGMGHFPENTLGRKGERILRRKQWRKKGGDQSESPVLGGFGRHGGDAKQLARTKKRGKPDASR